MGSVYRARDLHFPNVVKLVAVKEMINQARDPYVRQTIIQNFEREADILVTLNHPAIPRIYDYFTHDERSYLVEEYIPGKDLEAILLESDGFMPEQQVIEWAIQLCDVLAFLHSHRPEPIIFRDMKPSNVMINQFNNVILVDFGIAKVFKSGQKGTMIGTEGYSPPEQYRGEATPLADIYALGATLHHMLTKKDPRLEPPFTFPRAPDHQIQPDGQLRSANVDQSTCLQYNPTDRFESADAMKEALLKVSGRSDAVSRPGSISTAVPVGSGILTQDKLKPLWTFECEDEVRGSPTLENGVLYCGSYDNNLYALNSTTGEFIWKYATEGGVVGKPAFYDSSIFVGSEDGRLHAVSARSGKVIWTYYTDGPVRGSPRVAEATSSSAPMIISPRGERGIEPAGLAIGSRRAGPLDTIRNERIRLFWLRNGELFCVDFQRRDQMALQSQARITSSPWVAQGAVFFGSLDATVYAVDANPGG